MILVTGATSTVGNAILHGLLERGLSVRAAVTDPAQSRTCIPAGSSVKRFDFNDPKTFEAALEGVERVFLMRPMGVDPRAVQHFLMSMTAHNIEQVVFLSSLGAQHNTNLPQRKIELTIEKLVLPYVFLRTNFFLQNLSTLHRQDILERHDLFIPAGHSRTSFIDSRDVVAVALQIMSIVHMKDSSLELTGHQALSYSEIATLLSEVLGHTISYSNPLTLKFGFTMQRRGIPIEVINGMILRFNFSRFGHAARVSPDVHHILGREPHSAQEFFEDFKHLFMSYG
jgi:uncharacterized protein YbjT (DUF2867 family)